MTENGSKTLVDEKLAVSLFLDSLLRETELDTDLPVASVTEIQNKDELQSTQEQQTLASNNEPVALTEPEEMLQPVETSATELKTVNEEAVALEVESEELAHPKWADKPFQALLFNVAGLKIAIPLVELSGVIKWKDSVTEMPGHADFYMGILQHLDYKVAVIDTAKMIIPEEKLAHLVGENPRDRVNHIVLFDNYRWGLACDEIGEVITLQPEDVRWRKNASTRTWLAGTVIEHMCALLNSDGFSTMLEKG